MITGEGGSHFRLVAKTVDMVDNSCDDQWHIKKFLQGGQGCDFKKSGGTSLNAKPSK